MKDLLAHAIATQARSIRFGVACAILAALSAVGLLALSGWFLAGAAAAGLGGIAAVQAFNYLLPSAAIRAAAIVRTGTRYGERMFSHSAALYALAQVRTAIFRGIATLALAGRQAGRSGIVANRLGKDVDTLEDAVIRQTVRPSAFAAAAAGLAAASLLGWFAPLILLLAFITMRLAARAMAARLLPEPIDRATNAHAALQADYADFAVPCADIAVYDLSDAMTNALAALAHDHDIARQDVISAEGLIVAIQTAVGTTALALLALTASGSAALVSLGLLGTMAALEAWSALAASDMRTYQLALAQSHIAALTTGSEPIPQSEVLPNRAVDLILCGRTIACGSRVLIRGTSGAGKTRLIETLVGLRADSNDGPQARLAGENVEGLAARRPLFALAGQDAQLLAGSVADNLTLARALLDEEAVWQALQIACVDDVVRALPDGLRQWLGGNGARLSGGQRRRIALARAILSNRPWLVLDEPSEGLDADTEARLVASLDRWLTKTGTGLVLVSHRPAMAALADIEIQL